MPNAPQTDSDWDNEAQEQEKIAEQIAFDTPVTSDPKVAGTASDEETTSSAIVEERPKVVLVPVGDDIEYPLTLSVVGAPEEGFVFEGPDSRIEVDAEVGEQVTYVNSVDVEAAE